MGPLGKHSEFADGYWSFPKLEGEIAPRMKFKGMEVLTWSLNNYLGLANHPEIRKADADAAAKWGAAYPMGARMMSGQTNLHEQLEDELAAFVMKSDGTDGCRVAFAAKEYAAGENGLRLDGAIVRIVDVFLPNNPNRMARCLYHHNYSYAVGKIVSFPGPNNNN